MRCIVSVLALLLAVSASVAGQDRIDRRKGPSVAGVEVTSEDYKSVTYKNKAGATSRIQSEDVRDIRRGDAPKAFQEGRAALDSADYTNAIALLKLAKSASGGPAWLPEYASFYLGEANRRFGQWSDAVPAYQAVLAAKADSRFLAAVRLGTARCQMALGQHDQAASELQKFVTEVEDRKLPTHHAWDAKLLLGANLEAQKKFSDAVREYESAAQDAARSLAKADTAEAKSLAEDAQFEAVKRKGTAFLRENRLSDASQVFSTLASQKTPPQAAAAGEIGKAAVQLAQGNADAARVSLSEVVAVRFEADSEVPDALFLLGQAYTVLHGKGEKGADKMARIYFQDLIKNYPDSERVKEARSVLQGL